MTQHPADLQVRPRLKLEAKSQSACSDSLPCAETSSFSSSTAIATAISKSRSQLQEKILGNEFAAKYRASLEQSIPTSSVYSNYSVRLNSQYPTSDIVAKRRLLPPRESGRGTLGTIDDRNRLDRTSQRMGEQQPEPDSELQTREDRRRQTCSLAMTAADAPDAALLATNPALASRHYR